MRSLPPRRASAVLTREVVALGYPAILGRSQPSAAHNDQVRSHSGWGMRRKPASGHTGWAARTSSFGLGFIASLSFAMHNAPTAYVSLHMYRLSRGSAAGSRQRNMDQCCQELHSSRRLSSTLQVISVQAQTCYRPSLFPVRMVGVGVSLAPVGGSSPQGFPSGLLHRQAPSRELPTH